MTLEEYETTIRPALAKFCGWKWSEEYGLWLKDENNAIDEHSIHCPDPLHNPADAWALYVAILRGEPFNSRILWYADTHDEFHACVPRSEGDFQTAEAALVAYAWEIVTLTAERPSGE